MDQATGNQSARRWYEDYVVAAKEGQGVCASDKEDIVEEKCEPSKEDRTEPGAETNQRRCCREYSSVR